MCKETITQYSTCYCRTIMYDFCARHIEHTRMQIDEAPCPARIRITRESARSVCDFREDGVCRGESFYSFESNGARMFENKSRNALELKERREREDFEKREKEERERKLAEREERDRLFWQEKRKKKFKREKLDFWDEEVDMSQLKPWPGQDEGRDGDDDHMAV